MRCCEKCQVHRREDSRHHADTGKAGNDAWKEQEEIRLRAIPTEQHKFSDSLCCKGSKNCDFPAIGIQQANQGRQGWRAAQDREAVCAYCKRLEAASVL